MTDEVAIFYTNFDPFPTYVKDWTKAKAKCKETEATSTTSSWLQANNFRLGIAHSVCDILNLIFATQFPNQPVKAVTEFIACDILNELESLPKEEVSVGKVFSFFHVTSTERGIEPIYLPYLSQNKGTK